MPSLDRKLLGMSKQVVSKREIAREYLDAAIEFYLTGTNLFCAIHLAGAAEELLGKHLPEDQRIFTSAWKAEKQLLSETRPTVSDDETTRRARASTSARIKSSTWRIAITHR